MQSSLFSGLLAIVVPASATEIPQYEIMSAGKYNRIDTSAVYTYAFLKIGRTYYGIIDDGSDGTVETISRYDLTGYCSFVPHGHPSVLDVPTMMIPYPPGVYIFNVDPPLPERYAQVPRDTSAYAQKEAAVLKDVYADFLQQVTTIPTFQRHSHSRGIEEFDLDVIPNVHNKFEPDWEYWTEDAIRESNLHFFTHVFLGFSGQSSPVLVSLGNASNDERGTLNIRPLLFTPEDHRMLNLYHDNFIYGVPPALFEKSFPDIVDALQLPGPFLVDARVFPGGKIPDAYTSRFQTITPTKGLCPSYYLEK